MAITHRRGRIEDTPATFAVFQEALMDLSQRQGVMAITGAEDPAVIEQLWMRRGPLFEHLARTAEEFWLAEEDGVAAGYARSILRDGVRELTEFFVRPGYQSAGIGRELMSRAFLTEGARRRVIVATTDSRALARYLKTGVYARFPVVYFSRRPRRVSIDMGLELEPLCGSPDQLEAVDALDQALLDHRRREDHLWLMAKRSGFLYRREGQPVGYGYVGQSSGPFALLEATDFPSVLAHAESHAADHGEEFGVEAPLTNRAAVDYLLAQGFQMSTFIALFMSDAPFGKFENYLFPNPPFFL